MPAQFLGRVWKSGGMKCLYLLQEQKNKNRKTKTKMYIISLRLLSSLIRITAWHSFHLKSARKLLKEMDVDLIHSHGIATTGLAAIDCASNLKIPLIASFHTMVPSATHYITSRQDMQKFLESASWKYLRWYYKFFKRVLVPSHFTQDVLKKEGIGNTLVMPAGINCRFYSKGDGDWIRKRYRLGKKKIVLHVGRVVKEKKYSSC